MLSIYIKKEGLCLYVKCSLLEWGEIKRAQQRIKAYERHPRKETNLEGKGLKLVFCEKEVKKKKTKKKKISFF
jgi:hypothetical protein